MIGPSRRSPSISSMSRLWERRTPLGSTCCPRSSRHYETHHWPVDLPDPVDVIRFRMEQGGFAQGDLAQLLGSKSRASEVLSRRRRLTMEQVSLLHRAWGIPAEALLPPVPAAA